MGAVGWRGRPGTGHRAWLLSLRRRLSPPGFRDAAKRVYQWRRDPDERAEADLSRALAVCRRVRAPPGCLGAADGVGDEPGRAPGVSPPGPPRRLRRDIPAAADPGVSHLGAPCSWCESARGSGTP